VSVPGSWTGLLTESDFALYYDGSYIDIYEFYLEYETDITVELSSTEFDTYLFLLHLDTTTWEVYGDWQDDDSGGGTDSSISVHLSPGTYWAAANSYEGGVTGSYTLVELGGNPATVGLVEARLFAP
jgi:hypothetical protein